MGRRQKLGKPDKQTWVYFQPLVDFYNLHLESDPLKAEILEEDKHKARKYLGKYAPDIFAEGATPSRIEGSESSYKSYGTLEHYMKTEGKDWFDSIDFKNWLSFWREMRRLLDDYIAGRIGGPQLQKLATHLRDFQPSLLLEERVKSKQHGRKLRLWQPSEQAINLRQWRPTIEAEITGTERLRERYKLDIGPVIARIVFGFYTLLRVLAPVKRCTYTRCQNIFIPHPQAPTGAKAQKYCPLCKKKRKTVK